MPDEAKELFDRFSDPVTGYEAILQAVEDDIRENIHLDFKQLRSDNQLITNGRLTPKLREHLATSVSAFANTSGGVLVWGVRCEGNSPMSADPVPDVNRLCEHMKNLSVGIVEPTAVLEHRAVANEHGQGFVVTYVPTAQKRPIMATFQGDNRYYLRTTDNCVSMSHSLVESMMAVKSSPTLNPFTKIPLVNFREVKEVGLFQFEAWFTMQCNLAIHNAGPAIAREVYITISGFDGTVYPTPRNQTLRLTNQEGKEIEGAFVVSLPIASVIHPGQSQEVAQLEYAVNQLRSCNFEVTVFAEGFAKSFDCTIGHELTVGWNAARQRGYEMEREMRRNRGQH